MNEKFFEKVKPNIINNDELRDPQKEGYKKIVEYYNQDEAKRETGMVLPVGCGKSGAHFIVAVRRESQKSACCCT